MLKKTLFFILILAIASIFLYSLLYLFTSGMCRRDFSSNKVFSPDSQYFVQISEGSCGGATGENSTDIIVANARSIFSNYDFFTILNAQTGNQKGILKIKGSAPSTKVSWLNSRTLKVSYPGCGSVYGMNKSWRDIKIVYEDQCSYNNGPLVSPGPTN